MVVQTLAKLWFTKFQCYSTKLNHLLSSSKIWNIILILFQSKVEKVFKGSLDHLHLQWKYKYGQESLLEVLRQNYCRALSTNFWKQKVFWHHQQCFALLLQETFLPIIWIFTEGEDDRIQAIFLNLFYFTPSQNIYNIKFFHSTPTICTEEYTGANSPVLELYYIV